MRVLLLHTTVCTVRQPLAATEKAHACQEAHHKHATCTHTNLPNCDRPASEALLTAPFAPKWLRWPPTSLRCGTSCPAAAVGRKSKPCHHQQPQSNMLDPVEGPSTWLQHEQPPREKTSSTNSANSVPKTTEPSHMHSRNPQMPTQRKQQVTCCLLLLPRLASLTTAAVRAGGQHAQKKPSLTAALPARTGKKQREKQYHAAAQA